MKNNKPAVYGANKVTDNRFLNMYDLNSRTREGQSFTYQCASRAKCVDELSAISGEVCASAVAVVATYQDKLVVLRQYRYPVGDYIYELPAGLIENREGSVSAAKREMFEETGLTFEPINASWCGKPWLSSPGMTDEAVTIVAGVCTGTPTVTNQESTEDIQVLFVDRDEAIRILNNEKIDMRTAWAIIATFGLF
jgi:ADP-ribose pyrophosphatase